MNFAVKESLVIDLVLRVNFLMILGVPNSETSFWIENLISAPFNLYSRSYSIISSANLGKKLGGSKW